MKRPIFVQPSEPIDLTPRSKEEHQAELVKLAEQEQVAKESLREVLAEIDVKKVTKSQLETNILQLEEKEKRHLKQAGDAKEVMEKQEALRDTLFGEVTTLREEKRQLTAQADTILVDAQSKADRASRELVTNTLLKKGLLFVSFYITEALETAKAKLVQADEVISSLMTKIQQLDKLLARVTVLHDELIDTKKEVERERDLAKKSREEAQILVQQNRATEEELQYERSMLNRERRRFKMSDGE